MLCIVCLPVAAQTDSLETILATPGLSDREQLEILQRLIIERREHDLVHKADYAQRYLALAEKLNDKPSLAFAWKTVGSIESDDGEYAASIRSYLKALELYTTLHDSTEMVYALNNIGVSYFFIGEYRKAIENYVASLDLAETFDFVPGAMTALMNIALVYGSMENYDMGVTYLNKVLPMVVSKDTASVPYVLSNLGFMHFHRKEYTEATQYVRQALLLAEKMGMNYIIQGSYTLLGAIKRETGQRDSAYYYLKLAKEKNDAENIKDVELMILNELYLTEKKFGNRQDALEVGVRALTLAKQQRQVKWIKSIAYNLYDDYYNLGDHKRAADNLYEAYVFSDSISSRLNEQISTAWTFEQENRQLAQKNAEIENRLNVLGFTLSLQRGINVVIALLLIITVFVLFRLRKISRRLKTVNALLNNRNGELSALNARLEQSQQETARLTSFIVHDLKSPLNSMLSGLQTLKHLGSLNEGQQTIAGAMNTVARRGIELVHQLLELDSDRTSVALRKEMVSSQALRKSVDAEFGPIAREKDIALVVEGDDFEFLSVQSHLSRILANLTSNAIKFSPRTSAVTVTVHRVEEHVVLKVADQGPGFTEADKQMLYTKLKRLSARPTGGESSHGLGLALVKALVDQLGGSISLETTAGKGATFTVRFPA